MLVVHDSDDPGYVETDPTGRYGRFDEVLGKGAMKTVYRAFDEQEGIEVAWNQTRICDVLRSPDALERLYSEVNLLSTLGHDSIIQYHASWVDTGKRTFNFITEMFTSGTLREYRQRYRRVDIRAVKNWARQVLHGLVYLHGHDPPVIHRDLKCDNIFVNGHLGQVKIGDLGLAAVLRGTQPAHSVIGTPEFMAPELYEEEYNELVDVYSFGMCVLEMLTAEYPYSECSNPAQIYKKVTSGKLPQAFYQIKDPEARQFIGKCLSNVSLRSSAEELLLDPFLQQADTEETQPPRGRICKATSGSHVVPQPPCHSLPKKKISTDMKITGKMNDDDTIFLRVQIAEKDGNARNIYFPFDIISDTAIDVAHEMVKELEITDRDPFQIAEVIDQEISALVPDWKKEESAEDGQPHVYSYGDDEDGSHHPFYYPSSPTSSQLSSFSRAPSQVGNSHHGGSYHTQDWPPEYDIFPNDNDDTSSQSSMHYSKNSYVNYNSSGEQDFQGPEPPRPQSRDVQPSQPADQKSIRFCPEASTKADLHTTKLHKHSCVSPEPPPSSVGERRKPSDGRKLTRNKSLVDMRSQLLHRTLVEELNKRAFKTVGSVENIGYQHPCEPSRKGKNKPFHGACKRLGLAWGRS